MRLMYSCAKHSGVVQQMKCLRFTPSNLTACTVVGCPKHSLTGSQCPKPALFSSRFGVFDKPIPTNLTLCYLLDPLTARSNVLQ